MRFGVQRSSIGKLLCVLVAGLPLIAGAQTLPAESASPSLAPATDPVPLENALSVSPPAETPTPSPLSESDTLSVLKQAVAAELPDFADRVELTAAEADQLIELFAERRFIEGVDGVWPRSYFIGEALAADLERRQASIDSILGERLAAYREYMETLPVRRRVLDFNSELALEDQLGAGDLQQLIAALYEVERSQAPRRTDWFALLPVAAEPADLAAKRFNVERVQYDFFRLRDLTRLQLQRAEALLAPRQFDVFFHIESERLRAGRAYIEGLRADAGLEAKIPE